MTARMHFLTPTYRPAGGVVKVFDYAVHALDLGYAIAVHCPDPVADDEPLLTIPRFAGLRDDPRVTFHVGLNVGMGSDDWVVFSWPRHYEHIQRGMSADTPAERVIHLVQNTRHANPAWIGGYALRLLSRPMARIMVAEEVTEACRPFLNQDAYTTTIVEGHDWEFFHRRRSGGLSDPVRVAYTTWKSRIGIEVEERLDERFVTRSIRATASWNDIADLLRWCDVFLCCPGPQEGFYLPGLEAFAAGAIVITPDVGGNRAYCRFGENCRLVPFEDADAYVAALDEVALAPAPNVAAMRERAYDALDAHRLERERTAFNDALIDLAGRTAVVLA